MHSSAFSLRHSLRVVFVIGWSDFVMKYRGSILGYFWSLIGPLTKFLVIFYVFQPIIGGDITHYSLYLFLGIIYWEFFVRITSGCMGMLHDKSAIIQKIPFPRILLIFAVGWTNVLIFITHLMVFFLFAAVQGVHYTASILYLPLVIGQSLCFMLGVGMMLSSYSLRYRDIPHAWEILLQILFWLTPIMYSMTMSGPLSQEVLLLVRGDNVVSGLGIVGLFVRLQPVSILLHDIRRTLLPDALGSIPTFIHAVGVSTLCIIVFAIGAFIFYRRSKYFLQEY